MTIIDPVFGLYRKRTHTILDQLVAAKPYRGHLIVELHPELCDDALCSRLAAAGTLQIGIGLQTVSVQGNQQMGRRFDPRKYRTTIETLNAHQLSYYIDVIYGLPGDSLQGFLDTVDFVLGQPHTEVQFYRLLVLPGTRYHNEAHKLGLAHADTPPYMVLATDTFPYSDLMRAHRVGLVYHALLHAIGAAAANRLVLASGRRPSELLVGLAAELEKRHVMSTLQPDSIETMGFAFHHLLDDCLKNLGLPRVVEITRG